MMDDEKEIRSIFPRWQKASLDGDTETLRSLMAEDIIFLTAEFPPIIGREAFLDMGKGAPKPFGIDFDGEVQEVEIFGDWAYTWNHLVVTVTPVEGAEPIGRSGNILTVLHKENGKWVLKRDANMLRVEGQSG